jgi:hypothetical protein
MLVDRAAAERFPGYFTVIMASGTTSITSHLLGLRLQAWAFTSARIFHHCWRLTRVPQA